MMYNFFLLFELFFWFVNQILLQRVGAHEQVCKQAQYPVSACVHFVGMKAYNYVCKVKSTMSYVY